MNTKRLANLAASCACAAAALLPAVGAAQRQSTVSAVQIQPSELQVQVGQTTQAFVQAYDRAGNALISVTVFTWRSNKPATASVDSNGIITGHAPGYALVTARYGSARNGVTSDPATVEVLPAGVAPQPQAQASGGPGQPMVSHGHPGGLGCAAMTRQQPGTGPADGLYVSPQRVKLIKGESVQLQYHTVRGLAGELAEPACIVFTVDAGQVAQVDSFGLVSSVKDTGHAVLTVTVPGARWAPKQIAVEVSADSVQFSQRHLSLAPGVVDTLNLVVATDRRPLDPAHTSFQYESSDTTKVRISSVAPVITGVAPGSATIRATSGFYPDLATTVTVHPPIHHLSGTPVDSLIVLAMQSTATIGVRFYAADSTQIAEVPVHWTLPDTTFARFDTATMTLRGIRMGETRLRVWARANRTDSVSHSWHVRVVAGGLQIATPRLALPVGERRPLAVQLLDEQRHPLGPAGDLRWTSTDTTVARVVDGNAVGTGMGHALLEARTRWDSTVASDVYVVGDLLLAGNKGGRWDLYMADRSDLTKVRPLMQDSAFESQPVWSPDWRRIAFTMTRHSRSALSDLVVANADGSAATRLTDDSAMVRCPSFVPPSGDLVVFESSRGAEGWPQLYVIGRNGTGRRQLTHNTPSSHPDASPDGKKVLFVSFRAQNYDVYEMNLDGTGEQRLTTDPRPDDSPVYAADGKSFFFLRLEGGKPATKRVYHQDLVPGAPAVAVTPAGVFVQSFSVSADGHTLALTVLDPTSDGSGAPRLELFDVATQGRKPLGVAGLGVVAWPAFRPLLAAPPQH